MLVKTLGRKGAHAVARSLAYIARDQAVMKNLDGTNLVFTRNIYGKSLAEVQKEFQENEAKRLHRRSNNNQLLHTVLSFHPRDKEKLTTEKLQRLTEEYFKLLNPDALYYATVHQNTDAVHVHCIVSGSDILGNATRIDREKFHALKEDLQQIQQDLYPELEASVVNHGAEQTGFIKPDYWHKDGRISQKELLHEKLSASFELAHNRSEFFDLVKQDGLTIYSRGGTETGVSAGRNYRFTTMGLDLAELDKREERLNELEALTEVPEKIGEQIIEEEGEISEEEKRMKELDELDRR
jgi:hypothetical protein